MRRREGLTRYPPDWGALGLTVTSRDETAMMSVCVLVYVSVSAYDVLLVLYV